MIFEVVLMGWVRVDGCLDEAGVDVQRKEVYLSRQIFYRR